jgi:hypothetical protein|tara:strand:+ start:138 stop:302 length:165 start_codon:yes stop_codon:yes gene_type:complete
MEFDKATVQNLTGQTLDGEALEDFKKMYSASAMIRGMYNPDGSIKEELQELIRE